MQSPVASLSMALPTVNEVPRSSVRLSVQGPSERVVDDVCGIVLAGRPQWGESHFERVLRGPLLPIAQTPLIRYPLEWMRAGGITSAVICCNSASNSVQAYLGGGAGVGLRLDYTSDVEPRGPAGCAHDAMQLSSARTFLVVEGAVFPSLDLRILLEAHRRSGAVATVVAEIDRRRRALAGEALRHPGGVFLFERRVIAGVSARGYHDIKQGLLEKLYQAGERVMTHEVQGISPRVLDFPTYSTVSRWLIARTVEHPVFLTDYVPMPGGLRHPSAFVDPSARIVGPVLLAADARVEAGAVLVGPASVGAGSVIGRNAVVSRTSVWDRCLVGSSAVIDASLLTDHTVILSGARIKGTVELASDAVLTAPRPIWGPAHRGTHRHLAGATPAMRRGPALAPSHALTMTHGGVETRAI